MKPLKSTKRIILVLFFVALGILLSFFVFNKESVAPQLEGKQVDPLEEYYVFWLNSKEHQVAFYWKDEKGAILGNFRNLRSYLEDRDKELIFAMNGGIFDPGGIPKGLYIQKSQTYQEIDLRGGEGNFYLQPNGIFFLSNEGPKIIETSNYQEEDSIEFALQSGPLLLENRVIHPEFNPESESRFVRNGVGINEKGDVVFVLSKKRVTLHEFARFFKEDLKVDDALYLDGSISRLYWPEMGLPFLGGDFGVMVGITSN